MVSLPPRPEVITVTSESLQAKVRQLLPSQMGFGADLAAQNVIVPIIDLTASAEGSDVRVDLQTALAFGSQTAFSAENGADVIANTGGFYRVLGTSNLTKDGATPTLNSLTMTDGSTTKTVWAHKMNSGSLEQIENEKFDLVFYLNAGDSVSAVSSAAGCFILGSSRQIADSNGTLVQPSGFIPQ